MFGLEYLRGLWINLDVKGPEKKGGEEKQNDHSLEKDSFDWILCLFPTEPR